MRTSFSAINRVCVAALVCSALVATTSKGQTGRPQPISTALTTSSPGQDPTAALLKSLARNNDMAIALTEVGARRAQNENLKRFCEDAQPEEIQINEQLKPVARQHGLSIDRPLTKQDEAELAKLQSDSGQSFDRTLASFLVREQAKNLRDLQQASAQTASNDLKGYIEKTLPKARQELQQAQAAANELGLTHKPKNNMHATKAVGGAGEVQ